MKVSLLHYSAPPVVGGVESVLAHHAHLMSAAGHQVQIIAGRGEAAVQDIPFIHLPLADSRHPEIAAVKADLDHGLIPPQFSSLVSRLGLALNEALAGIDILIAHNVGSLHKNLPLTAAVRQLAVRPGGPRLILWHHDLAWTTSRYRSELHDGFPWDLLRYPWSGVTQVVVSELRRGELSELFRLPPKDIRVIPNGVDLGQFLKLEPVTQAFIRELNLLDAQPLILLPVRITRRKNIELALRALAALCKSFPNPVLVVTGPLGPHNPANKQYFQELVSLRAELGLQESAHFLAEHVNGFLPDAVIADCYHFADALLLPSHEEGFGIPILEAGLAGLPVFCADISPLLALGGKEATYFSPSASPDEVAAQIFHRISSDKSYRLRLRVRQHYTWDQVYREHIQPLLQEFNS